MSLQYGDIQIDNSNPAVSVPFSNKLARLRIKGNEVNPELWATFSDGSEKEFQKSNSSIYNKVCGETISSGNAVYLQNGLVYKFDSNDASLQNRFYGIALQAANIGGNIDISVSGEAVVMGLGLTPNINYFAGINGTLSTLPTGLISQMVGFSIDPNTLKINQLSILT